MVIMHSKIKRSYLFSFLPYVVFSSFFIGMGFSQITWQKNYGGASYEEGYGLDQTTDRGYVVVGMSASYGNGYQVYLVKTDSLGDTLWTRTYGGTGLEWGYSVQQTTDGGYIVTGRTNSFGNGDQLYLIKTNSLGDTLWTKVYGDTSGEGGYSVQQTVDGGYIVTGFTASFGNGLQVYLVKTDSLGDTLWTKIFGSAGRDRGRAVQQTLDRGYIIAGDISYPVDYDPIYLIRTDSLGDTLWSRIYGTNWYFGRSVQQTQDGGYIIGGYEEIAGFIYLIKTDSMGDSLWAKEYYLIRGAAKAYSVQQTSDKGYIVAGLGLAPYDNYYFFLMKTDSLGDTLWTRYYGSGMTEGAECVQQTADGGYILVGTNGGNAQILLIKTDQYGNVSNIEEKGFPQRMIYLPLLVRPNPFCSFTTIIDHNKERFVLYDITGRKLGSYFGEKIGFDLPPGVYFIGPEDKNIKPVKVIKLK
jgi:hypothetical protein